MEAISINPDYGERINPINSHPGIAANYFYSDYLFNVLINEYKGCIGDKSDSENIEDIQIVVNDWFPSELCPISSENGITFLYDSNMERDKYCYLPMDLNCIKICFKRPVSAEAIVLSDGNGVISDADIYVSYINEHDYLSSSVRKLIESNGAYHVNVDDIMEIYIHVDSVEKEYITLSFE